MNKIKSLEIDPQKYSQLIFDKEAKVIQWDFPGGTVVKNPPANVGDMGSSPGPGRSHMPQGN